MPPSLTFALAASHDEFAFGHDDVVAAPSSRFNLAEIRQAGDDEYHSGQESGKILAIGISLIKHDAS